MKTSSQLLIVRIATAASALLLASVPFVVTLSVLSMLLLIPSLMMIALFLGAVAEHCVISLSSVRRTKPRITSIKPVLVMNGEGIVARRQCQWFMCKCAA